MLDAGRIVGRGTHEELLETCSVYQEIAASQLSEEELAREAGNGHKHSSNGATNGRTPA